jgi:hypothetical protein
MKKETKLPEVEAFERIAEEIEEFKNKHEDIYQELQLLAERYNATHEMAYKAVRAKRISCGPFQLMGRPAVKYDPNKVLELFGEAFFNEYGGKTKQVTVYEIDRAQMDIACASGLIPQEEIDEIRDIQPRYHKPEKLVLP